MMETIQQQPQEDVTQSTAANDDIAQQIYSNIEALQDKQHMMHINSEAKFIPLPPSLPISPSISSPSVMKELQQKPEDCPCHHIFNEQDITRCSLCQSPIMAVEELLKEKEQFEAEIKMLQGQLKSEQTRIDEQMQSISALNDRLKQLTETLDTKTVEFNALQHDMELLNDKYVDEIERVAEIQHSKDMVESELEDLSRRLFEEANGMVANEKREKHNLEIAQKHLENQLKETKERLAAEQMQLKELKKRMEEMTKEMENEQKEAAAAAAVDDDHLHATADNLNPIIPKTPDHIKDVTTLLAERSSLLNNQKRQDGIDPLVLDEFQEFVRLGASVSLKKIHTIPFMKNCQEEDVEACLRFGPNSRLSARKINEAIVMNTCFIEEAPQGFAEEEQARIAETNTPLKISAAKTLMWERFSSSSSNSSSNSQGNQAQGCQACGRNDLSTTLPYRFRISYFDDWACIDRFCRDRLVAVCEFYVFIRNIRQGLYGNRSIVDLYHEAMRLRLQMFYARMGALPWTLRTANNAESRRKDTKQQLRVVASESSPLPKSPAVKSTEHETASSKRRGSMIDIRQKQQQGVKNEKERNDSPSIRLEINNNNDKK
ncbi:hypothetical protein BDF20DRAFT_884087 [Mycotypha africana]|uniref:uncharacterized protein n=1 Tax=Mycotypha africana TaxID=64632 RepID=UPI002301B9DA|nr:uncharacterized protein BDF20DRAFT_884087 [Mycotypha africana]KAI8973803.1 hypothetical protein BDF20DRAFT_884087 [Mycotypha africana]